MMFTFFWFSIALLLKSSNCDTLSAVPTENLLDNSTLLSLKEETNNRESSLGRNNGVFSDISKPTEIAFNELEYNSTELSISTVSSDVGIPETTLNPFRNININTIAINSEVPNDNSTVPYSDLSKYKDSPLTSMSPYHQTVPPILHSIQEGGNELDAELNLMDGKASESVQRLHTSEFFGTNNTVTLIVGENKTELPSSIMNEFIIDDVTTGLYNPRTSSLGLDVSSLQASEESSAFNAANDSAVSNAGLSDTSVLNDLDIGNDSEVSIQSTVKENVSSMAVITWRDSIMEHENVTEELELTTHDDIWNLTMDVTSAGFSEDTKISTSAPILNATISHLVTLSTIHPETLPPDIASSVKDYVTVTSQTSTVPNILTTIHPEILSPDIASSVKDYVMGSTHTSTVPNVLTSESFTVLDTTATFGLSVVSVDSTTHSSTTTSSGINIDRHEATTAVSTPNVSTFTELSNKEVPQKTVTEGLTPKATATAPEQLADLTTLSSPKLAPTLTVTPGDSTVYIENTTLSNELQTTSTQLSTNSTFISRPDENVDIAPTEYDLTSSSNVSTHLTTISILNSVNPNEPSSFTVRNEHTTHQVDPNIIPSSSSPSVFSVVDIAHDATTEVFVTESASTSSSKHVWISTSSPGTTQTHREAKHIPFSSPATITEVTDASSMQGSSNVTTTEPVIVEVITNISEIFSRQLQYEDLTPSDKDNLITAVIQFPFGNLLEKEDLDSKVCKIHNWLMHILTMEFRNWTKDPFSESGKEYEGGPFGHVSLFYLRPTPAFNSSHLSLTFIIYNVWRNDTLPVDFVLGILNFYRNGLKEMINASSVHFNHGSVSESYDLLLSIFDKYGGMAFIVGLAVLGVLLLMCIVILYRKRSRQSVHHLTGGKLQYSVHDGSGIDLNPAAVILEDEKGSLENGGKLCDDESWLVPIHQVPVAEEVNVPNVQDTKL